jgi:demethylmenaquinone methyltransferase/2-methoxy-6-polyprenyl-1,4-benzoquinol methylase
MRTPGARALDLCCGTGDLALALAAAGGGGFARVFGSDFCHPMLTRAREKGSLLVFEADALKLPLASACLDLVTVAFGFRNLADYDAGLAEMRRVLKPGGMAAILEFSQPPNAAFASVYGFYSRRILPVIGGAVSGARDAYTYLPESVGSFPSADGLARRMGDAGFRQVRFDRMTGGIAALHTGVAA